MSEGPINLNKVRKARARDQSKRQADANAVKFGRSKAERDKDAARKEQARRHLDGHQRDPE